jgi:hypothetical protein
MLYFMSIIRYRPIFLFSILAVMAPRKRFILFLAFAFCLPASIFSQHHHEQEATPAAIVDPQPLLAQALRLRDALSFLGSSLSPADDKALTALQNEALSQETVRHIREIFDPYCLAVVNINPEGRVKVDRGAAKPSLIQGGWTSFLVKVENEAGGTAALQAESPNAFSPLHHSSSTPTVRPEDVISTGQSINRFIDIQMYNSKPLQPQLSGVKLEYAVVQLYSKDAGKKEVQIGFNVGQGSKDIGFRNPMSILFNIRPSVKVVLNIKDDNGFPSMASFVFTDSIERAPGKLAAVYPLPSRRVAAFDEYPDFSFQKQVYRINGEHVMLPPGKYYVTYKKGPEYIPQSTQIVVPEGKDSIAVSFQLKRWINLSALGWNSADHHVHAAGCSHYDSPEEGVKPVDMWRQQLGEDLNFAAVLTWGPSWYYQKQYFTGKDNALSTNKNIMHYDIEISGFPSSHAGHLVLLRLKEDDYPGTTKIEEWPSWTLPVLKWAREQGGLAGYAHSGWGLKPMQPTDSLPNYVVPYMDFIGANEYIVTAALGAVDFYSAGDTPAPWELNMWYHTLNCGFRIPLSGETDFPCITDDRVGQGRSYFKSSSPISYDGYVNAIKNGRSYVSDGGSHIMNFSVNGLEVGTKESLVKLKSKQTVNVTADVAAYLPVEQTPFYAELVKKKMLDGYFWNIETARIGTSRKVRVELIQNGYPVDTVEIQADGKINKVKFTRAVDHSSWLALRIYSSAHSNPIYIEMAGNPIIEKRSAAWCIQALDQCWKKKEPNIRSAEKDAAKAAYDQARNIYENMVSGSSK